MPRHIPDWLQPGPDDPPLAPIKVNEAERLLSKLQGRQYRNEDFAFANSSMDDLRTIVREWILHERIDHADRLGIDEATLAPAFAEARQETNKEFADMFADMLERMQISAKRRVHQYSKFASEWLKMSRPELNDKERAKLHELYVDSYDRKFGRPIFTREATLDMDPATRQPNPELQGKDLEDFDSSWRSKSFGYESENSRKHRFGDFCEVQLRQMVAADMDDHDFEQLFNHARTIYLDLHSGRNPQMNATISPEEIPLVLPIIEEFEILEAKRTRFSDFVTERKIAENELLPAPEPPPPPKPKPEPKPKPAVSDEYDDFILEAFDEPDDDDLYIDLEEELDRLTAPRKQDRIQIYHQVNSVMLSYDRLDEDEPHRQQNKLECKKLLAEFEAQEAAKAREQEGDQLSKHKRGWGQWAMGFLTRKRTDTNSPPPTGGSLP